MLQVLFLDRSSILTFSNNYPIDTQNNICLQIYKGDYNIKNITNIFLHPVIVLQIITDMFLTIHSHVKPHRGVLTYSSHLIAHTIFF